MQDSIAGHLSVTARALPQRHQSQPHGLQPLKIICSNGLLILCREVVRRVASRNQGPVTAEAKGSSLK